MMSQWTKQEGRIIERKIWPCGALVCENTHILSPWLVQPQAAESRELTDPQNIFRNLSRHRRRNCNGKDYCKTFQKVPGGGLEDESLRKSCQRHLLRRWEESLKNVSALGRKCSHQITPQKVQKQPGVHVVWFYLYIGGGPEGVLSEWISILILGLF